jgi:23S rRNA (cytosine1962-C5)-methyltransferase
LLSRELTDIDTPTLYHQRIESALSHRRLIYPDLQTFRALYGEGDLLPGLIVDKYGDYLSVQFLTAGIDLRKQILIPLFNEIFRPKGIIARNDVSVRGLEGLDENIEILAGEIPPLVEVEEHGLRLLVDLQGGQKTGHFLDQKENHLVLKDISRGKRILDCFSYSGSWGIHAAAYGASSVTCLDISQKAVDLVTSHAKINGFSDRVTAERIDVFDRLRTLKHEGKKFDVIILDPPAFVKSKKALNEAVKGYTTINKRAMEILNPGGYLVTCSCSYHMGREMFRDLLSIAARQANRTIRLVETKSQAPDHPVLLNVPETEYLKCLVLQAI